MILFLIASAFAVVMQWSCSYDQINFPTAETGDAIVEQAGLTVTFTGRINWNMVDNSGDLKDDRIGEYGFVWDTTALPLVDIHATQPVSNFEKDPREAFGTFDTTITDFNFDESFASYNVRAYIILRGDTKYGRSVPFTFRTFLVANGGVLVSNNKVTIEGFLGITDTTNFQGVSDHGHVVSDSPDPTLTSDGIVSSSLGTRTEQGGFLSTLELNYNTDYYVRTYAITADNTVYSRSSIFSVNDGWNRTDPFKKEWTGGVAAVFGGSAAVGMGCDGLCGNENTVWTILPNTDSTLEQSKVSQFPTDEQRNLGSGFVIEDKFYFGLGFTAAVGVGLYKSNFFSYDLGALDSKWKLLQDTFPGGARSDAVGVVLDGKAYVGLGENDTSSFYDLWVFDPQKEAGKKWQLLTTGVPSPYKALDGASGVTAIATSDAIYFIGGKTGMSGYLSSVWRFRPPDQWEEMPNLGGENGERANSVGFAIGNSLYVGLGRNKNKVEYYKDFFTLDLSSGGDGPWKAIAPFPGIEREDAVAFVIDKIAYVGSGQGKDGTMNDVWRYTPETNE